VSPGAQRSASVSYFLATTEDRMRFYCFEVPPHADAPMSYELIDTLDRTRLTAAGNKATAKAWAKRMRLTGFTYVRV
jgi:hypothetical protein